MISSGMNSRELTSRQQTDSLLQLAVGIPTAVLCGFDNHHNQKQHEKESTPFIIDENKNRNMEGTEVGTM